MRLQKTKLGQIQDIVGKFANQIVFGSWKSRSLGLLSLLIGFYIGSNITVYYLEATGKRPLVVFIMVLIIEILIRLRGVNKENKLPIYWLLIDNTRIGCIYAVVLEAFKLGS